MAISKNSELVSFITLKRHLEDIFRGRLLTSAHFRKGMLVAACLVSSVAALGCSNNDSDRDMTLPPHKTSSHASVSLSSQEIQYFFEVVRGIQHPTRESGQRIQVQLGMGENQGEVLPVWVELDLSYDVENFVGNVIETPEHWEIITAGQIVRRDSSQDLVIFDWQILDRNDVVIVSKYSSDDKGKQD